MALSPETRSSDFEKSMKKYFVDNLETVEGIKVFFEWISDIPVDSNGDQLERWLIVDYGDADLGTVAKCSVALNLFTRNDKEGVDLAVMYDTIMDYILDEDSTNGLKTIPYYDTSGVWTVVGGIMPFVADIFGKEDAKDNTKMKTVHLLCKWGSK